ncbi:hypothetical protein QCA50_003443 [Cerrena zonata]|uniref:Uncharacterized protein n=1 Tax=Cerrena zonata TaxID=2478898 RepID=A0AAW0GKV7_9APHY
MLEPLVSLIEDQVDRLKKLGITQVVAFGSQDNNIKTKLHAGIKLCYMTVRAMVKTMLDIVIMRNGTCTPIQLVDLLKKEFDKETISLYLCYNQGHPQRSGSCQQPLQ